MYVDGKLDHRRRQRPCSRASRLARRSGACENAGARARRRAREFAETVPRCGARSAASRRKSTSSRRRSSARAARTPPCNNQAGRIDASFIVQQRWATPLSAREGGPWCCAGSECAGCERCARSHRLQLPTFRSALGCAAPSTFCERDLKEFIQINRHKSGCRHGLSLRWRVSAWRIRPYHRFMHSLTKALHAHHRYDCTSAHRLSTSWARRATPCRAAEPHVVGVNPSTTVSAGRSAGSSAMPWPEALSPCRRGSRRRPSRRSRPCARGTWEPSGVAAGRIALGVRFPSRFACDENARTVWLGGCAKLASGRRPRSSARRGAEQRGARRRRSGCAVAGEKSATPGARRTAHRSPAAAAGSVATWCRLHRCPASPVASAG